MRAHTFFSAPRNAMCIPLRKPKGIQKGASLGKSLGNKGFAPDNISECRRLFLFYMRGRHSGRGHCAECNSGRCIRLLLCFAREVNQRSCRVLRYPLVITLELRANHRCSARQGSADTIPRRALQLCQGGRISHYSLDGLVSVFRTFKRSSRSSFCRSVAARQHSNDSRALFCARAS